MDLASMIMSSGCECLNESDDHPLKHALTSKGGYLESDCDEQVCDIATSLELELDRHIFRILFVFHWLQSCTLSIICSCKINHLWYILSTVV